MHREVCLKHRKIRREMVPAGALFDFVSKEGSGVCSFCRIRGAGVHTERPRRSFAVIVQQQDA